GAGRVAAYRGARGRRGVPAGGAAFVVDVGAGVGWLRGGVLREGGVPAYRCGKGAVLGAEHVAGGGEFVGGECKAVRADGVRSVCEGGGDRRRAACDDGAAGAG